MRNSMHRRTVMRTALGAGAVVALVACGQVPAQMAPSDETAATEPAPKEPVTIVYGSQYNNQWTEKEITLFDRFNAEMEGSGVQVELQRMADNQSGGSALRKYVAVRAAGGVPLNFFENNWGNWLDLVEAGMMQNLTALYAADSIEPTAVFTESSVDFISNNNKIYGVPSQQAVDVLLYNQDMFTEAGLEPLPIDRDPNWTMEAFTDVARKLTKEGQTFGMSRRYHGFNSWGETDGTYFGGLCWDADAQQATMNTEAYRLGMTYWLDLQNKHRAQASREQETELLAGRKGDPFFVTGQLGMQNGAFIPAEEAKNATFKWGLGIWAYSGEGNPLSGRNYAGQWLVGTDENIEGTWTVLKWLMKAENTFEFMDRIGWVASPNLAALKLSVGKFQERFGIDATPILLESQWTPQSGHGTLKYPAFGRISEQIRSIYVDEVRAGTRLPEEYMPIADKVIQVEMDADLAIYGNL